MTENEAYREMYRELKELSFGQAMQLLEQAKDEEERSFFLHVINMNAQRKQQEAIERNWF